MDPCQSKSRGIVRVKSACRTCKVRKIKCDEGRPACHRCVSTGRICDGYGIWGGGGNSYHQRTSSPQRQTTMHKQPVSSIELASGSEGLRYFEWFQRRSARKLPASFQSGFWHTLILQASHEEPAVLHAVLALSCLHKTGTKGTYPRDSGTALLDSERFMLHHYVKAIEHLRPHLNPKLLASTRVTLITCLIFVFVDMLRGHFITAKTHLKNGLRILQEMKIISNCGSGILHLESGLDSTDRWIVEAYSRLQLQVELFKYIYHEPCIVLQSAVSGSSTHNSLNEAWMQLEHLFKRIFHLSHQSRLLAGSYSEKTHQQSMIDEQQLIRKGLSEWLREHEKSHNLHQDISTDLKKASSVLRQYHTMAGIMNETCLHPSDEMIYDKYTDRFMMLMSQALHSRTMCRPASDRALADNLMDMSSSVIDVGGIAPLYYVASKCRVHNIRVKAIELLESSTHREGFWDSGAISAAARKIMTLEEGDFCKDAEGDKSMAQRRKKGPQGPPLPASQRLREADIAISGTPMNKVLLSCKKEVEGRFQKVLVAEYDMASQTWTDRDSSDH